MIIISGNRNSNSDFGVLPMTIRTWMDSEWISSTVILRLANVPIGCRRRKPFTRSLLFFFYDG